MKKIVVSVLSGSSLCKAVAVLEYVASNIVVRYFEPKPANSVEATPLTTISALQDTGDVDLVFVESEVFYTAAAFPEKDLPNETLFIETARHWVGPSINQTGLFGFGEVYDFAALVAPVSREYKPAFLYNHFAQGTVVKAQVRRMGRLQNTFAHLMFVTTKVSDPVSQWSIVHSPIPGIEFIDRTDGSWETATAEFSPFDLLPSIEATTPAAVTVGSYADVVVQTKNRDGSSYPYTGELVVDALVGYPTKNRINMVDGQGLLRVMPLGLDVGDVVTVKINTRTVSGMTYIRIPVA